MLQALGISVAEEALYRALLAGPDRTVAELASRAGIDRQRVHADLARLRELELVRECPRVPSGVAPVEPATALRRLADRVEEDLRRRYIRIPDVRAEIMTLIREREQGRADLESLGVEEVVGVAEVRERIAELAFFARTSVDAVHPVDAPSPAALAAARPLDLRSLQRGLAVRVVFDGALLGPAGEHLRTLAGLGAAIRLSRSPMDRLILFDARVAVVPLDPDDVAGGAVVVRHPGLVATIEQLFERTWSTAAELPTATPTATAEPSLERRDVEVLQLLADSCTDEAIGRRTGMSARHVRRRVARLMDELGVSSRFAAGVAATRRGWL